jgi:hypothetical protein
LNNEIKYIMSELEVIYAFYQDKFSLKRIKAYILSMPEGSKIVNVEPGQVSIYDHMVTLPIADFNDTTDSVSLLQLSHTMVNNRQGLDLDDDAERIVELVNRLIKLLG